MQIKKREKPKFVKKPFLTGDIKKDFAPHPGDWHDTKRSYWRSKEDAKQIQKFYSLSKEEREKLFPRGTEDYIDQLLYEREHPGRHYDDDPFDFAEWLNKRREKLGIPTFTWNPWRGVEAWQEAMARVYPKEREKLGFGGKAIPPKM
ncbi:MAG: hypothetical protein GTN76_08905 [Candidatus Aenigmarchaeota archaeon]|nr:hypothetical protein [Candidatus Aenigmarchaeota archaeon]